MNSPYDVRTAHTRERAYAKMARIFYSCVIFGDNAREHIDFGALYALA